MAFLVFFFFVGLMLTGAVVAEEEAAGEWCTKAEEALEEKMAALMAVTAVVSVLATAATTTALVLIVKMERALLLDVEEKTFAVIDAVLVALLPSALMIDIGCKTGWQEAVDGKKDEEEKEEDVMEGFVGFNI